MKLSTILSTLFALAAWGGSSPEAQFCSGPDNLQGPCCSPTFANLPNFPIISLGAMGICYNACNPAQVPNYKAALAMPAMVNCSQYTSVLSLTDPGGATVLGGGLRLDYTRTWFEIAPAPAGQMQVWRFMVKGDLSKPAGAPAVCPAPACLAAGVPTAFFYGYLDYVLDCITGNWSGALVLYHGCDRFMHKPGISAFPGAFHGGISYAIVAPATAANPFIPAANPSLSGPLIAEAMRDVTPIITPPICMTEEPLSAGFYQFIIQICACPFSLGIPMHSINLFQGSGTCPDTSGVPSSFAAINFPGQPWVFEVKSSIGSWTNPLGGYPGAERVWVEEGVFTYHDSCSLTGVVPDSVDIFYGASTAGGFPVIPTDPGTLLSDKFIDMASNFTVFAGTPAVLPAVNLVLPTRHLIYANIP